MKRCFYPKPFPKESIGSVMLRACGADTITLNSLMKNFGGPTENVHAVFIPILRGEKTVVHELARLDNWTAPKPHRKLLEDGSFIKWINYDDGRFCSECAREGALPWMHDFNDITVCQRHRLTMVTQCKKCERKLSWNRRGLNICICGNTLCGGLMASPQQLTRNAFIEKLIVSLQFERLRRILDIEAVLIKRYNMTANIDQIDALADGNQQQILSTFQELQSRLGNLPPRMIVAPLLSCGKWIEPAVDKLASLLIPSFSSLNSNVEISCFHLTRSELTYAWATTTKIAGALQKLLTPTTRENRTPMVTGKVLAKLYTQLSHHKNNRTGSSAQQLRMTSNGAVEAVLQGRLRAVVFDPLKPLKEARFEHVSQNQNTLTLAQAAVALGTYYEAVRHLIRVGLLSKQRGVSRHYIDAHELERFREQYILTGEIARKARTKDKRLSEKVVASGVEPISGPRIDSGLIYVFRRNQIDKLDLHKTAAITDYVTNSGRKPSATKSNRSSACLDGTAAAKKLGISVQRLSQFETTGLLQREFPPEGATRLRYYSRCSVERTGKFMTTLVPVRDIEFDAKVQSKKFRSRCRALIDYPLFRTKGNALCISQAAANKALQHIDRFWDADMAAKYLGVGMRDIQNWRKLGHLTPLKKGEAGYIPSLRLYRKELIEVFSQSDFMKQRDSSLRKKQLRH